MKLVIVETPAQAKIVSDALGDGWRVEACYGPLRDFPAETLGIDLDNGLTPAFRTVRGRTHILRRLRTAYAECDTACFAVPPGRRYDLMAWQVQQALPASDAKPLLRVDLTVLTHEAIRAAVAKAEPICLLNVDAEIAERILHRLIDWQAVSAPDARAGLNVPRSWCSTVALHIADQAHAEREAARGWGAMAVLERSGQAFPAQILNRSGQPVRFSQADSLDKLRAVLTGAALWVEDVTETTQTIPAPKACTVVDLLVEAAGAFGLTPVRTLTLLSVLYEAGWITHPDGQPPEVLREAARDYIRREYGEACLNPEAIDVNGIAPTSLDRLPERLPGDGLRLYDRIWRGFVAAQMAPAQTRMTAVRLAAGTRRDSVFPITLRSSLPQGAQDGWQKLYAEVETPVPLSLAVEDEVRFERLMVESPGSDQILAELTLTLRLHDLGWNAETAAQSVSDLIGSGLLVAGEQGLRQPDAARLNGGIAAELLQPETILSWRRAIRAIELGERSRRDVLEAFWQAHGDQFNLERLRQPRRAHRPVLLKPVLEE